MKREWKTWPGRKKQAESTLPADLQKRIEAHIESSFISKKQHIDAAQYSVLPSRI